MSFFYRITEGIRITVHPRFVPEQSDAQQRRYVFAYHIRIENVGDASARLLWRHWYIHDAVGGDSEIEGEGVVGQTPLIEPAGVHEYQSFCVLAGPQGHMEGYYELARPDGRRFRAVIPRFVLRVRAA